jgi:acetylornithine deacetylase
MGDARRNERVEEANWISLASELISCHPTYGSEGLSRAQHIVAEELSRARWDEVIIDNFCAQDIMSLEHYVSVESFSPLFQNYTEIPKTNVLGILRADKTGRTVFLNGHVDVDSVSTPELWSRPEGWMTPEVRDDRLYGRGAADMLASVAAMIRVANVFAADRKGWRGTIVFQSVTDEEIGGNGTLRALELCKKRELLGSDPLALIGEPSNNRPCYHTLGFLSFNLTLSCRSVHMGVANREDSLIPIIGRLSNELPALFLSACSPLASKDLFRITIGSMRGGVDPAIPLNSCTICGTAFFPAGILIQKVQNAIHDALAQIVPDRVMRTLTFDPLCFPGSDSSTSQQATQMASILLKDLSASLFPSPCDARLFEAYGIPSIVFGPGSLEQAHSVDEFIEIASVENFACELKCALQEYLK